jgi:hypothetical protein
MRLQVVAPSGFAGRVIAAYRDGVAARDLVFLVFGVRREAWGAERLYVLKVVLDVKSRGSTCLRLTPRICWRKPAGWGLI